MTECRSPALVSAFVLALATMCEAEPAYAAERGRFTIGLGLGPDFRYLRKAYTGYLPTYGDSGLGHTFGGSSTRSWGGRASVLVLVGYTEAKKFHINLSALEVLEHSYHAGDGSAPQLRITQAIFALGIDYRPGRAGNEWFVSGGAGCGWVPNYDAYGPAVSVGGGRDLGGILQVRLALGYFRYAAHLGLLDYKADQLDATLHLAILRH